MKTNLPTEITTVQGAIAFLTELHNNGDAFHPEDDATQIDWRCQEPTQAEQEQLNKLMADIYALPGTDGRHCEPMIFDPCEYLNLLYKDDKVITIDGEATTIGEYMKANDWDAIKDHISIIAHLEDDEDYVLPVHCGFVTIKSKSNGR